MGQVSEFKELEPRFKFKPWFKYGWFHLKLYQMFQDLSRGSNSSNSISDFKICEKSLSYQFKSLLIDSDLKGVFAKNERGYRLNAIKKRF